MTVSSDSLPKDLLDCLERSEVPLPSGKTAPLHSNVSRTEAETLYQIVRELRPSKTVEIGFGQGISAVAILQALEDNSQGEHVVIDPYQKRFEYAGLEMVKKCRLEGRLRYFEKFPEEVLPQIEPTAGFGFIDASHLFDLTLTDFLLMDKVLIVGGATGFHDLWMPSLQKALRFILANHQYEPYSPPDRVPPTLKHHVSRLLHRLPKSDRVFSQEILRPWSSMGFGNMVILRKLREDRREWQFHKPF